MTSPDYPQTLKNFACLNRIGVLSSVSASFNGYPFGSIVPYDVDESGRFVILISDIAEHYRNLVADPRACLFVHDRFGVDDPQAHSRAAFIGTFNPVPQSEKKAVEAAYCERFPEAVDRTIAHTFHYFRMLPERIRWIADFGDIRWVDAEHYSRAPRDDISYRGYSVLRHMNNDHRDALKDYFAHYAADKETGANNSNKVLPDGDIRMVDISSTSFALCQTFDGNHRRIEIEFSKPLTSIDEVRDTMVGLLKKCRAETEASQ